jgi:hypothetical protein
VLLILRHPKVAFRPCEVCQKWQYNEQTGDIEKDRRTGDPDRNFEMRRIGPTPCRTRKGCPKGTPEDSRELTRQNTSTYRHYLDCKATGLFPDDPVVRRNAGIIREIEDAIDRNDRESMIEALGGVREFFNSV